MRANVPEYELVTPTTLKEALQVLKNEPGVWKPFAGGTDLMVLFEAGVLQHKRFVNIGGFKELRGVSEDAAFVTLGALTTYSDLRQNILIQKLFPLLCCAAKETGAVAIQNRGTVGGNIVNASPAADSPPVFLVYEAQVEMTSIDGSRWESYSDFHQAYKKTALQPFEILTRIRIPKYSGPIEHYYRKVGTRKAQAISKVCLAGRLRRSNTLEHVRVALGSVAPIPIRCFETEKFLNGKIPNSDTCREARKILLKEISPITDIRSTSVYRNAVAANLLEEFLCGTGSQN